MFKAGEAWGSSKGDGAQTGGMTGGEWHRQNDGAGDHEAPGGVQGAKQRGKRRVAALGEKVQ